MENFQIVAPNWTFTAYFIADENGRPVELTPQGSIKHYRKIERAQAALKALEKAAQRRPCTSH